MTVYPALRRCGYLAQPSPRLQHLAMLVSMPNVWPRLLSRKDAVALQPYLPCTLAAAANKAARRDVNGRAMSLPPLPQAHASPLPSRITG